jgi:lipid-A-disaccharide synthase
MARSYPEIDRVQGAEHFWAFLLWGKTAENWDWRSRGVVLFLGGDQFFAVAIARRYGYRTVVYAEWEARWHQWMDRFGVMKPEVVARVRQKYAHKFTVVGDLMAEVGHGESGMGITLANSPSPILNSPIELIGLLPGSKPAKLAQGLPLGMAIAERIHAARPQTRFVIPVAPTLNIQTLAKFADPKQNPVIHLVDGATAELIEVASETAKQFFLKTSTGILVELWTGFPAHELLSQCHLCLTTVGANTAELGALAVPMIVLLPTQQLDAMRAWDGLPGMLANLPGVGSALAKVINRLALPHLAGKHFAWPNIWAQSTIVPELLGKLHPQDVAERVLDFLEHPEKLAQMRSRLRSVRGQPGASEKLAQIVCQELAG